MKLHSLKLKNIRSYLDEEIIFPEGSILLSGDIGSGKTTILLAIEFALFGILKGTISGTTLLRHGKKEGVVELRLTVGEKEVIIHRTLKRGQSVKQEAGYIVIDNTRQDCTAVELKSKILELIGYPDELLTKSKSLIFRYTIYTPQEEMKHILYESPDERLDTIRRIFNIDKYKRIKENTINILRDVRSETKILLAKTEQLPEIEAQLKDKETLRRIKTNELHELDTKLLNAKKLFEESKENLEELEQQVDERNKQRKEQDIIHIKEKNLFDNSKRSEKEHAETELRVKELRAEMSPEALAGAETIAKNMSEIEKKLEENERKLEAYIKKESGLQAMLQHAQENIRKFTELDSCPLCLQEVPHEHKKSVIEKEKEKTRTIEENLKKILEMKQKGISLIDAEKKELKGLHKQEKELDILKIKQKQLKEKEERISTIREEIETMQHKRKELTARKTELDAFLKKSEPLEKEFLACKKEHEKMRTAYHEFEVIQIRLKTDVANLADILDDLKKQAAYFEKIKVKIAHLNDTANWLDSFFMNLMGVIERQILQKIYAEFNMLFQDWFNILMEDETTTVRLQDDFSPLIEQNGYETYLENLSGGERTSVALAYRLALFKIINDFMSTIKTKDIIILDEPTDGFSSEQLDKVRDILDMLQTKQTIIVSHEAKLESFVEHVIRIVKEQHVSRVLG
ncbi:MAG: hypothetical protein V1743_06745 [Nanoarchaeota archaeon]